MLFEELSLKLTILSSLPPFSPASSLFSQVAFQKAILLSQLAAESQTPLPYITDRCIIDPLTYTLVNFGREKAEELRLLPGVEPLLEDYRSPSTLLVLFEPVSEFWHDDGARKQVEDEQEWWALLGKFEEVSPFSFLPPPVSTTVLVRQGRRPETETYLFASFQVLHSVGIKSWKRLGAETKDLTERVDLIDAWIAEGPSSP